jgi:hypothetical protein
LEQGSKSRFKESNQRAELSRTLKPGFGQINVTLDSAQGLVVNGFFVAQFDHGVAFWRG